jgi:hypothetical protein
MSTNTPPFQRTWSGVVKGQPPTTPSGCPLLQLYKDYVARGTWARLCLQTKGCEEELSISYRVGASTSRTATKAAQKQGAKKSLGGKKKRACSESSAAGGAAAVIVATGAASQPGAVARTAAGRRGRNSSWDRSSSCSRSSSFRKE